MMRSPWFMSTPYGNWQKSIVSLIVWSIINMIFGLRVTAEEEDEGVDLSECGLEAYPEFSKSFDGGPSVYPKK